MKWKQNRNNHRAIYTLCILAALRVRSCSGIEIEIDRERKWGKDGLLLGICQSWNWEKVKKEQVKIWTNRKKVCWRELQVDTLFIIYNWPYIYYFCALELYIFFSCSFILYAYWPLWFSTTVRFFFYFEFGELWDYFFWLIRSMSIYFIKDKSLFQSPISPQ